MNWDAYSDIADSPGLRQHTKRRIRALIDWPYPVSALREHIEKPIRALLDWLWPVQTHCPTCGAELEPPRRSGYCGSCDAW